MSVEGLVVGYFAVRFVFFARLCTEVLKVFFKCFVALITDWLYTTGKCGEGHCKLFQ